MNFVTKKVEGGEGKGVYSIYVISLRVILSRSSKSELGTKVQENIGGLRDDEVAVLEERRRKVRRISMAATEPVCDGLPRLIKRQELSVFVRHTSFLEHEPHMLTATWNARVINKFVGGRHADTKVEADEVFLARNRDCLLLHGNRKIDSKFRWAGLHCRQLNISEERE